MRREAENTLKSISNLVVAVALSVFLLSIMACSAAEDAAKDIVDINVEASTDLTLDPITVNKAAAQSLARGTQSCNTNNPQTLLNDARADIEAQFGYDLSVVDITSVTLDYLSASYTAVWTPDTMASIACTLTINDTFSLDVSVDSAAAGPSTLSLSQAQIDTINGFLATPNQDLTYCLSCSDTPDTYTITYDIQMGVTIHGNV